MDFKQRLVSSFRINEPSVCRRCKEKAVVTENLPPVCPFPALVSERENSMKV